MRAVVLACFFLSGASGLIFEMVWTRGLTLVFGSTTLAISTVLATFMGGLGLGSYLAGKVADRLRAPARAYAFCELLIGAYALVVPLILARYPALNEWLWRTFGDRYALLSALRFAASALLLLIPTTLMGATLPILARYLVARPWEIGRVGLRLGTLYSINLFGAVAGAFLAGFVFMPLLGVRATNLVAAGFNFLLATAVLGASALAARHRRRPTLDELAATLAMADAVRHDTPMIPHRPAARRLVLLGFCLSGMTAMTLQVLWSRALAVVLGSSIFSFTLILLAFLIGLGLGSAVFGRLADREPNPVRALALLHMTVVAAIGVSYVLTDELPFFFAWLMASTSAGVDAIQVCQFVAACVTVLPATFLMGGVFPFTVRVVTARFDSVARDLGGAYALNTLGAITGSFLAGFVVLPSLGLERGIYASALITLALSACLFLVAPALTRRRRVLFVAGTAAMALGALLLPRWNLVSFSTGFFRVSMARDYIQRRAARKVWQTPELMYYRDGYSTTVSVDRWGTTFAMKNNGKVDASSDADMPTQISVGLLPLLLYPHDLGTRPPTVGLIGFGSGVTAGSITQFPIRSLEVVELEPAIYEASHFFDHVNNRPLQHPRVTARVGDGRNFLTQRRDRFDVLISQPSNPWITGVSNLFTREYFRAIRQRLAPDGLFCQWAQLYEMSPWNIKTIYRTLREEFPHVLVFAAEDLSSDTILVASPRPITIDRRRISALLADARTGAEARRAGFESAHDIPAQLLLTTDEVEAFTAGAAVNTDDNARIEFSAPRDLLGQGRHERYLAKVYGPFWPYGRLHEIVRGYEGPGSAAAQAALSRSLLRHGKGREARHWLAKARAQVGPDGTAAPGGSETAQAALLVALVDTREGGDPEIPLLPSADIPSPPADVVASLPPALAERLTREYAQVAAHFQARRYTTAYKLVDDWPPSMTRRLGPDMQLLVGFLRYKAEFYRDAIDDLKVLAADAALAGRRPALLYYLGRAYFANAAYGKAIDTLERYIAAQRAAGLPLLPASAGR
jgi:spermidine synthase